MALVVLANAPIDVDDVTGAWTLPVTSVPSVTPTTTEKTAVFKAEPGAVGDNTVIAAVPGKKIRVTGYIFSLSGQADAVFKSGAATEISAKGYGILGGEEKASGELLFETNAGEALVLNLSAGVNVAVQATYVEV